MSSKKLPEHYQDNDAVRAICDHFATRERNQNETKLRLALRYLEQDGHDFNKSNVIQAFRLLEDAECGKYIEGRHGWESRFAWLVPSKLVASAAQGDPEAVAATEDEFDEETEYELIEHSYILRPDLTVSIELPASLTRNEALRLSQFIDSLSFEE
ncbi:hypothetical protein ACQUJT_12970 [Ralstonia pseudosolanacearum]|uniref:hypothetical protein n=1 Tax=Ralstonia pseudosolanacearum TaxID=1310165 RepID=UPI001FF982FF|nr:hypothetical protein [Ralstonia pseudosolanacearum]